MERAGEIVQTMMPRSRIQSHHDTVTALSGASLLQPGVIVIAGTGAITYGQLADGRNARADGWGYLIGDEGSAYEIGCSALKAIYRALDGRGQLTILSDRILEHFKMSDLREVHRAIYGLEITRPQIAGLASVVGKAAAAGDDVARGLLDKAGRSLAESVLAVIERLGVAETVIMVYTTGGVFRAGDYVLKPFREALASQAIIVREAAFSPVVGALFMALNDAGTALTPEVIELIQMTLPAAAVSKQAG
jgi:N-acetylglucosamine kinase-like BadF-type ATPase